MAAECQPNRSAAIRGASRSFASCTRSVSSTEVSSDLDFDDEQRARGSVPGKDVDRASLAVHRVGDLRTSLPASRLQDLHGSTHQRGMGLVHQPVELTTTPANDEKQFRIQRLCDLTDAPDRHCRYPTALQPRDHVLARPSYMSRGPAVATRRRCRSARILRPVRRSSTRAVWWRPLYRALIGRAEASNLAPALRWAIPRSTRRAAPHDGSPAVRS